MDYQKAAELENARFLLEKIKQSDAVLVGAASGFSAADGKRHWYETDEEFIETFRPFIEKYNIPSTFEGFYYPWPSEEERWAFTVTAIHHFYETKAGQVYKDLKELLGAKPYHIMTTNQDFLFFQDFPADKISEIQGDWRYFQCSNGCCDKLWDNREMVDKLYASLDESGTRVDPNLIPRCDRCGAPLTPWLRHPGFLEGSKYHEEYAKIRAFLDHYRDKKILFLELGVGRMTPMFIQEPFWNLTYTLPFAYYISVNPRDAYLPAALGNKGRAIHEDIAVLFRDAVEIKQEDAEHQNDH